MSIKRKNAAAVALGLRAAEVRRKSMTPKQVSEQARRAVQARWRKAKPPAAPKPGRWWGLFIVNAKTDLPEVVMWSRDRDEVIQRGRREKRGGFIIDVDHDPTKLTIVREYRPNVGSQVKALSALLDVEGRP